jgi:dUTP pyrophosphatase
MSRAKTKVKVELLDDKAQVPSRAHNTDTGYDLTFTGVEKMVGDVIYFKTGISLQPPSGYYFEVVPRSSISKLPLSMANSIGVIDESYTGEVLVAVRVHHPSAGGEPSRTTFPFGIVEMFGLRPQTMASLADLVLKNKPKLFQAILRKRNNCDFVVQELEETSRGDGGFGSTDSALS